ncbi:MAG: 4-(cytidine 5'-diphospho)-2-C-methyl-D-erythritol kinase [Firmicutes bacterium]|nr:4-(cytidine 5'-diphospho)-2-C-methyl-D-erythritol kinase [Bacillota bacterium]
MIRAAGYAKINLYLEVVGLLPDGYHRLESVMQTLALHDLVTVAPAKELSLEWNWADPITQGATWAVGPAMDDLAVEIPTDARNLAWKAAEALREFAGVSAGARISISKAIPAAAGLAGGSADAAATLVALNQLWQLQLPFSQLLELGATLGADVPFCLAGGCQLCTHRGDQLSPLSVTPDWYVLLLKPPLTLATKAVYQTLDQMSETQGELRSVEPMVEALAQRNLTQTGQTVFNRLEAASFALAPTLKQWKGKLGEAARQAVEGEDFALLMSGSGPTLFALFPNQAQAHRAARLLEPELVGELAGGQILVTGLGRRGAGIL